MTTVEIMVAEAAIRRGRASLERIATARIALVFRKQGRAFPALRIASYALDRSARRIVEAIPEDELLGMVEAVWAEGTLGIARAIVTARVNASQTAGSVALAEIGYDASFTVGELILTRVRMTALEQATGIEAFSKRRMRDILAQGIANGDNPRVIAKALRAEIAGWTSLSPGQLAYRAETIARTEVSAAWGQTTQDVFARNGWGARRWITAHDERVDQGGHSGPCIDNEAAGDVPIDLPFPSGVMSPPEHPRCRCTIVASAGFGPGERFGEPWAGE